jgi:hypothetical protein
MYRTLTACVTVALMAACQNAPRPAAIPVDRVMTKAERDAASDVQKPACKAALSRRIEEEGRLTPLTESQLKYCEDELHAWASLRAAMRRSLDVELSQMPGCVDRWDIQRDTYKLVNLEPEEPHARAWLLMSAVVYPPDDIACLRDVCAWRKAWAPNVWTTEACRTAE